MHKVLLLFGVAPVLLGCGGSGDNAQNPLPMNILVPFRPSADGFVQYDATKKAYLDVLIPAQTNHDIKPTKITIKGFGLSEDVSNLLVDQTPDDFQLQENYYQVLLNQRNLPSGSALTPSKFTDAVDLLRRGDAYIRVEWPNGMPADVCEVGDVTCAAAASSGSMYPITLRGETPATSHGYVVLDDPNASLAYLNIQLPAYRFQVALHLAQKDNEPLPALSAAYVDVAGSDQRLQLRRTPPGDAPLTGFEAASSYFGAPSDQDLAFRAQRDFYYAAEKGQLRLHVYFKNPSLDPNSPPYEAFIPLTPKNTLPPVGKR